MSTRNGGKWTEARFKNFIISGLRALSTKWPPKYEVKRAARLRRGVYLCSGYHCEPHEARAKDIHVDHINPVVDPDRGFTSFDEFIKRLFVEANELQVLCKECHAVKTQEERRRRK